MALNPLTARVTRFKFRGGSRVSPLVHRRIGFDPCDLLVGDRARAVCKGIINGGGNGSTLPFDPSPQCDPGFVLVDGVCRRGRSRLPDIDPDFLSPGEASERVGEAVMGRYGAGIAPGNRVINRAVCLRGMQLGNDGVCYNKSQITNKERMWPAGRKPLLTGGDMRCISTAARAAGRLERTTKRLQKIGIMKKAAPRRKMITSGPTEHHHH